MFKSIRWKFIIIYFLLVFIAMIIIGVFLIQQFEQYHLEVVRNNLTSTASTVMATLRENNWQNNKQDIQENIKAYERMGMEIYIIDKDTNFTIISSTNPYYLNHNALDILETDLITNAFSGAEFSEKDILPKSGLRSSKNIVYPLYDEHSRIIGAIYLRSDLSDIYKTLDDSKDILIRATILALFITVVLGYFIAKSITGPINDVTVKAEKMAKGDFDQVVEVKSDDEIGQLANMFNFLTARLKSVLQEMSSEKQKMDTIITYMADGIIAATVEGTIIHANPRAMELLMMDEESLKDKVFDEIFAELNDQLTICNLMNSGNDWSGSQMLSMGEGITLRANYAPYRNDKGDFGGIIVLLQDVTEEERLEHMRREFVANVSHELKTPLTTIKSYTETLLDGAAENQELLFRFLNVIDTEADRMSRLVRDLLQLSNLDFQQAKWNKKPIDINYIVKKATSKLEVYAHGKQQRMNLKLLKEPVYIFGDEDRIEQVLLNILSNSIKYTPNNGEVIIDLIKMGNDITLEIQDNGIGIPEADMPRIFERFYRVDKARSREMGGTGLGLAIAKEIIDVHDGEIRIISKEGEGTLVVITLPILQENVV
ncbi:sensor histidine kinase [Alkaliphilus peptidifermentans]|uniref:histidine kinase n=1 Tax=Alkaliphilus peptidifermentans DSM 18978 TaxID=1120976 RepID=A0A1G5HDT9_9FIRM|nr:ATP-binding protein [Alkaliphilus peptidifermentans]SCY61659.1 PAS/PAC sensor signal transduction histidine kinase [Alkaliphilus peptidifermentans DSM 18978]